MRRLYEYINESIMITERYVNIFTEQDKYKYADDVWNILNETYKYCGGLKGLENKNQLIDEFDMWKLVRKNDKIIACALYSHKRTGRKRCYSGSLPTPEGIAAIKGILNEDIKNKDRKTWSECSAKVEVTLLKNGGCPIPAKTAKLILKDKEFVKYHPDGFHYTRKIGNSYATKIMIGNISEDGEKYSLDKELIQQLIDTAKNISKEEHN